MPETKHSKALTVKDLLIYFLAGVMVVCGGILVFLWYSAPREFAFFGVIGVGVVATGGYLLYANMNTVKSSAVVNIGKTYEISGQENCLNLYARKNSLGKVVLDKLIFETMTKPEGQPHQVLNNNKHYYFNKWNMEKNKIEPLELADEPSIPPDVLAKYIELPAQRKYLKHRDSMMKMIGPVVLAVFNIITFFVIIALSG
jgi:drug/metabolite transporter superfamily protein YnfA